MTTRETSAAHADAAKPAMKNCLIIDTNWVREGVLADLRSAVLAKFPNGPLPTLLRVHHDWTRQTLWFDAAGEQPQFDPDDRIASIPMNEGINAAQRMAQLKPSTIVLFSPHFFTSRHDPDWDAFPRNLQPDTTALQDRIEETTSTLRTYLRSAPNTEVIIFDPCVQKRKEITPKQTEQLDALVEKRRQEFARSIGLNPDKVSVVTDPNMNVLVGKLEAPATGRAK